MSTNQAGKGSAPRNCFSQAFKKNYDNIKWNVGDFKRCAKCGAIIRDYENPERQLKDNAGSIVYICSKEEK